MPEWFQDAPIVSLTGTFCLRYLRIICGKKAHRTVRSGAREDPVPE
jgi:hypothetical protein